ncbi:IclR family transcriptional regulator [Kaistia granuli]|uniref:IclR family transcriptional regulator n=1 Tax=Kaistia granuli TaxID=363259 RepID=UPI00035DF939|nr:IclR family transcriptional regulator [Kaistia granuli]
MKSPQRGSVEAPAEDAKTPRRTRVSGMDRALQILDHLYTTGEPAGAYAIAKSIGAPLSTVYVIIDELIEREMLSRRSDGQIWLGPRLYHYGLVYARSLDFLGEASQVMQDLGREIGETVQICGRDGDHMVVLAMADGPGHFRVMSEVGTRVPLNWTASGRLLIGNLPDAERIEIFRRSARASPTERAETDAAALSKLAGLAFQERLSIQISETDFLVSCVASPICDAAGACVATISIVLPEHKVVANPALYGDAVRNAAETIERKLGWRQR